MWRSTLGCLALALVPGAGWAQSSQLKDLSIEDLATVRITTVAKQPEPVLGTAAAVYVISSDDIRRSGATTLPDVLRLAPGLTVNQSDGNRWAVGIRGFEDIFSKGVLVLIDGRSVYTPLVGGVHWAAQDLVLADIERIEVIRGPGASLWGANAVNGVINIIMKAARDTPGLRITAATGNVEHGRAALGYGASLGSLDYRAYVKAFRRGPQFHHGGANFDDWNSVQGGFRADWETRRRGTLTLSGDLYRTDVGERAQVSRFSPPTAADVDGRITLTGGNVILGWEQAYRQGGLTQIQAFYDHTNREGFTFGEARDTWDVDVNVRVPLLQRHLLGAGGSARISPSRITPIIPTLTFLPNRHTHRVLSAYVNDEVWVVPNRLLTGAGLKLEHNPETGAEWLPSLHALWSFSGNQRLWARFSRAVRTPSRFERDLSFQILVDPETPVYVSLEGSQDFTEEKVMGAEAGYRLLLGRNLYVDAVAFNQDYEGLAGLGESTVGLEASPIPHLRVSLPFANAVDGESRGIEIAPDWKPRSDWRLSGSYSYLRVAARNRPGFSNMVFRDMYEGAAPRHQVRLQSRLDAGGLELDQTYRFVSRLAHWDVPAYHALDLRVGWSPLPGLNLSIVGQNVLDAHHQEFTAVPVEIRRSAYVRLSLTR